jgi:hypothetical protein
VTDGAANLKPIIVFRRGSSVRHQTYIPLLQYGICVFLWPPLVPVMFLGWVDGISVNVTNTCVFMYSIEP